VGKGRGGPYCVSDDDNGGKGVTYRIILLQYVITEKQDDDEVN
jgi:hypothetical protein